MQSIRLARRSERLVRKGIPEVFAPGADPEQALLQLLRDGIIVEINRVVHGNVRVSIDAPGGKS